MTRLLVHVEGETEEQFVNDVLAAHLVGHGYEQIGARLMGNARLRSRRGGVIPWRSAQRDVVRHLREDAGRVVTTMVDYYGLPRNRISGWPGRAEAVELPFSNKARAVEDALSVSVRQQMDPGFNQNRFVPFVVMHEFEALLFSDCEAFARGIGRPDLGVDLQRIRDHFEHPEEINDSPHSAPSKQIEVLVPGYQKPLMGTLAALEIGLGTMRDECPHFGHWLDRLEGLPRA